MFRRLFLPYVFLNIFLLAFNDSQAWEYKVSKPYSTTLFDILELDNKDFLVSYIEQPFAGGETTCYLLRLSPQGQLVSEFDASTLLPDSQVLVTHIRQDTEGVILYGFAGSKSMGYSSTVIRLDQNLLPVWDTTYTSLVTFAVTNSFLPTTGHTTLFAKHGTYYSKGAFIEMDSDFRIIRFDSLPMVNLPRFISHLPGERTFYGTNTNDVTIYDDSTYNLLNTKSLNGTFHNQGLAAPNNTMLLSGSHAHYRNHTPPFIVDADMCIFRVDSTLEVLDSVIIDLPNDQSSGEFQSLAQIEDYVYFGGVENFNYDPNDHPRIGTEHRPFLLYKLNGDLDVIWQKKYVEDAACVLYRVFKTSDNHLLLLGSCYNWQEDSNRREVDLRIIKIDTTGNFVGIPEPSSSNTQSLKIYPNPAQDQLHISLPTGTSAGELFIIDAFGRNMIHFSRFDAKTSTNISSLNPGVYTVLFKSENFSGRMRLVKER